MTRWNGMSRQRRLKQSSYDRAYYERNAETIRAKKRAYKAARRAKLLASISVAVSINEARP